MQFSLRRIFLVIAIVALFCAPTRVAPYFAIPSIVFAAFAMVLIGMPYLHETPRPSGCLLLPILACAFAMLSVVLFLFSWVVVVIDVFEQIAHN